MTKVFRMSERSSTRPAPPTSPYLRQRPRRLEEVESRLTPQDTWTGGEVVPHDHRIDNHSFDGRS